MITVMVITESIKSNEKVSASIIGGFNNSICVIATTDIIEAEHIFSSNKYDIDIFIIQIKMRRKGGRKLAESVRSHRKYRDTPILFITSVSHNVNGYTVLATYQGYKRENYISTPIQRIDVQSKIGLYLDQIIKKAESKERHERVVFLDYKGGETFVEVKKILFAEVQNRAVTLYTSNDSYVLNRTALDTLCRHVGAEYLMRCHKSFASYARIMV